MTNLSQLKRDIENLKAKQRISDDMLAFDTLHSYLEGCLSYEDAINILNTENSPFRDLVRVLLVSSKYDDETKKGE